MASGARDRLLLGLLAGLCAGLPAACLLDLGNLSSGGTGGGGGGGAGTTSSSSSSGGAGGATVSSSSVTSSSSTSGNPDGGCSLLDCTCVSGPSVVAAGAPFADSPRGIVVTSDGVFWADEQGGAVVHAPEDSGMPEKIATAISPRAIAVTGSTVVWTAQDGVQTCTLPSCSNTKKQIFGAAAPGSLRDVAFDGQSVLFTDSGSGVNSGKAIACALGSCAPIAFQDSLIAAASVTLHNGTAYWTDTGNGNQNGGVARSPAATKNVSQIAASLVLPAGVAVDDTYTYWTQWMPGGRVFRCAHATGYCDNPEDIAPMAGTLGRPHDIRVGGGRIYWINEDDLTIVSCPQPGCGTAKPKVHVSGRMGLQKLAVGTSCLFWTESGDGGAVMRVAR